MHHSSLQGRTILVTRPGGLSAYLGDSISKAGGKALHLPSMSIQPVEEKGAARHLLEDLTAYDILIFVSRNAVKYTNDLLPDISNKAKDKTIFAVGGGTREELQGIGFSEVCYTDSNTGSDALLDMDELQPGKVANKKIMIVRGVGGRELLGDKLLARGAKVQYVELYRRARPDVDPALIKNIWLTEKPDIVLVTSVDGLNNLLEMTAEDERSLFLNTRLLVISERLKCVAETSGFKAMIKVAPGYSDDDFMLAITDMFGTNSDE